MFQSELRVRDIFPIICRCKDISAFYSCASFVGCEPSFSFCLHPLVILSIIDRSIEIDQIPFSLKKNMNFRKYSQFINIYIRMNKQSVIATR